MNRILLLGANGQVGWELQRALAPLGELLVCDRRAPISPTPKAWRDWFAPSGRSSSSTPVPTPRWTRPRAMPTTPA